MITRNEALDCLLLPAAGCRRAGGARAVGGHRRGRDRAAGRADCDVASTARDCAKHLRQAEQQYRAMTGGRGMERLLVGYRTQLSAARLGGARGGDATAPMAPTALWRARMQSIVECQRRLERRTACRAVAVEREQLEAARRSAATLQVDIATGLENEQPLRRAPAADRRHSRSASDQKAILDLQARIAAEQGMLQNEQTKLNVLYQTAQAEEWAREQRAREQAIADVGSLRRLPAMGL